MCARGWAGTCTGGVRFSNSNRIIPSDYRILHLLKMPIPKAYTLLNLAGPDAVEISEAFTFAEEEDREDLSGGQSTQIKYLSKSTDTYNKILLQ